MSDTITFAETDSSVIESSILTAYESIAGVTLYPGDPVRLFLEALAYTVTLQNGLINLAGRQNLVKFATGAHLEHLGALVGVTRIAAQPAQTTLRFSIDDALGFDVAIPEGTRVGTQDAEIAFATVADAAIPAGDLYVDVVGALCTTNGESGTGLAVGQVCLLIDPLAYVTTVSNVTVTADGADEETDDRLRERIQLAPESFTVAGSKGAYEAAVLAVSSDISAVSVYSSAPGVVDVRFVLDGGELPDDAMVALVEDALDDETVRPLTDTVQVAAPDVVDYEISGTWYIRRADSSLAATIVAAVEAAVEEYRLWQRGQPGRDINPSKLIHLVCAAGAKRVDLASPTFTSLAEYQLAVETSVNLVYGGIEDE